MPRASEHCAPSTARAASAILVLVRRTGLTNLRHPAPPGMGHSRSRTPVRYPGGYASPNAYMIVDPVMSARDSETSPWVRRGRRGEADRLAQAESERFDADTARRQAELDRLAAETARKKAEAMRVAAETTAMRLAAERDEALAKATELEEKLAAARDGRRAADRAGHQRAGRTASPRSPRRSRRPPRRPAPLRQSPRPSPRLHPPLNPLPRRRRSRSASRPAATARDSPSSWVWRRSVPQPRPSTSPTATS